MIALRPLRPRDAPLVASVYATALAVGGVGTPWSTASLATTLEGSGGFGFMAEDGPGQALGVAVVRAVAGEAELLALGVTPQARRQGVARQLLAAVIDGATARGATRLLLEVAETNRPARALYEAAGFRQCGRRPGYYGTADALTLERPLG